MLRLITGNILKEPVFFISPHCSGFTISRRKTAFSLAVSHADRSSPGGERGSDCAVLFHVHR